MKERQREKREVYSLFSSLFSLLFSISSLLHYMATSRLLSSPECQPKMNTPAPGNLWLSFAFLVPLDICLSRARAHACAHAREESSQELSALSATIDAVGKRKKQFYDFWG